MTYDRHGEKFSGNINGIEHRIYSEKSISDMFFKSQPKYQPNNWTIMPGNLDLCQLRFIKDHPNYDYYWFCEDDVRYTGDFNEFIANFKHCEDDLLCTNKRTIHPDWAHRQSYTCPFSKSEPNICVFLPFFRLSKTGAQVLTSAFNIGWSGHHEILWPAIFEHYDLKISDFNDHGSSYYTSNLESEGIGPGTFVYEPPRAFAGFKKNKLWHPVKPFRDYFFRTKELVRRKTKERIRQLLGRG